MTKERTIEICLHGTETDGIYADRLCVEGNNEGEMAELRFIRDEDGSLVALPEHIKEQLVS